jgi:hypothetical protein
MTSRIRSISPSNFVEFLERNIDLEKELENFESDFRRMKLLKYENRIKKNLVVF